MVQTQGDTEMDEPALKAASGTPLYLFKYLTPQKIPLLVLVHTYCNSLVAAKHHALLFKFLLQQIQVVLFIGKLTLLESLKTVVLCISRTTCQHQEYRGKESL
jgi:hypothetical protein